MDNSWIAAVVAAVMGVLFVSPLPCIMECPSVSEVEAGAGGGSPAYAWTAPVYTDGTLAPAYETRIVTDTGMTEEDYIDAVRDEKAIRGAMVSYPSSIYSTMKIPDRIFEHLAHSLEELQGIAGRGYTPMQTAMAVRAMAASADYEKDSDSWGARQYAQTPAETLWLGRGDCEDLAILFACVMDRLGYGVRILEGSGHVMAAVRLEGSPWADGGGWTAFECTSVSDIPAGPGGADGMRMLDPPSGIAWKAVEGYLAHVNRLRAVIRIR